MSITTEIGLIFSEFATELQIFGDKAPALLIFCLAVALVSMIITGASLLIAVWIGINK